MRTRDHKKPKSELEAHKSGVEASFKARAPKDSKEAKFRIAELTGVTLSTERVRVFMLGMGMKCLKTGSVPAKADPVEQQLFIEDRLEPLIKSAQNGECHLFFMDAAHFVLGSFVGMVWCFARIFIKSAAGRNRINVLGAFNPILMQLETVINTDYVNAQTIADMLRLLAEKYADLPIHIILDNARYQHCAFVKELAKELKINLVFLPPYSPNLNLIERLWKFTRKKIIHTMYYDSVPKFHNAVRGFMAEMQKTDKHTNELKSLMTLKFQTFSQN